MFPVEITSMILSCLTSQEIANVRLSSRAFRQLPSSIFHGLLKDEKEWLWEVGGLPINSNWYEIWMDSKEDFGGLKGLKNRRRVCKDVTEILRRIASYRS